MKKYLTFAVSFIISFGILQVLSGFFLTWIYTPDIETAWNRSAGLAQEAVLISNQTPLLLPLLVAFLAASIAYFVTTKLKTKDN